MIAIELDRIRHLRLTPNALADAEKASGLGIIAMVNIDRIGFSSLRALLWAGLKTEDPILTIEQVGNFMDIFQERGGTFNDLEKIVLDALQETGWFPEIAKYRSLLEAGGEKNPGL